MGRNQQITPQKRPPNDEEEFDKSQLLRGMLKNGMKISFTKKGVATKDASLAERTAAYEKKTIEQRTHGYKHYQSHGMKKQNKNRTVTPTTPYFNSPAERCHGFPLGKWPQCKYLHSNIMKLFTNRVDYNVDEIDIGVLTEVNVWRVKHGREMIALADLEKFIDLLEKYCVFKPKEIQKLRDENGEEVDDVCNVCLDGDTTNCNQIVYCEFCHLSVHQDCYGIPYLPEGALCCRRCALSPGVLVRCELCPSQKGAFKQLPNGKWVHVVCVIWVDETHFGNTIFMEYVQNVEKAIHDRRALSCQLCKNKIEARRGACIQCSETKCTASFHVTCARLSGLLMRIEETDDGHVNRFVWCMKHTPEETQEDIDQKERTIRNARRENEEPLPTISMPTVTMGDVSTINRLVPTFPLDATEEVVMLWYLKRRNRHGAPLLKKSSPSEIATRHRRARCISISTDPKVLACESKMKKFRSDLNSLQNLMEMVVRREDKKKANLIADMKLFELSFKSPRVHMAELLKDFAEIDHHSVFAKPVNCPGYRDTIRHPMCLQTMSRRLQNRSYAELKQFRTDLNLMLRNCQVFNAHNEFYSEYGTKFGEMAIVVTDKAYRQIKNRDELKNDKPFMVQLVNSLMSRYTGWSNKRQPSAKDDEPVVKKFSPSSKITQIVEVETQEPETVEPTPKRRKLRLEPEPKIEEADVDEQPSAEPHGSTPRRSKSRRRQDRKEEDEDSHKPSTSSYGTRSASAAAMEPSTSTAAPKEPKWFGSNTAQTLRHQVDTFGGDVTPKSSRKGPSTSTTPSGSMRQTTLNSFFCAVPKTQQVTFADVAATKTNRSLFDAPSTSKGTRSSSRSSVHSVIPPVTNAMKNSFRNSSSTLKSPLPAPKRIGVKALLDSDDDEDEIVLAPPQPSMTAAEIEAQKLKVAENEANSKYAHNQLVVVDGRAAKVIQEQLAHLGDIHRVQRQSIMKRKERLVLGEITEQPPILVEFFHKTQAQEPFKWVSPDAVELLDVNRPPKCSGLKAAKDWYNRVMNGDAS